MMQVFSERECWGGGRGGENVLRTVLLRTVNEQRGVKVFFRGMVTQSVF